MQGGKGEQVSARCVWEIEGKWLSSQAWKRSGKFFSKRSEAVGYVDNAKKTHAAYRSELLNKQHLIPEYRIVKYVPAEKV
jgi:hypothetical protein